LLFVKITTSAQKSSKNQHISSAILHVCLPEYGNSTAEGIRKKFGIMKLISNKKN
jgi:hypothetical protein